jgi:hypothetical protein
MLFIDAAKAVTPRQALASLIRSVHLKQTLSRVSQWTNSAIRMTMGMGMPSIKSKIERIVSLLNQFEITSGPILGSSATLANRYRTPRVR